MKTFIGKRLSLIIFLLLGTGFLTMLSAQTFEQARKYAFDGEKVKARAVCRALLAQEFDSDVAILMARTYAWDSKYDSARIVLNEVLSKSADNGDALSALADVEYWSENYPEAVKYCDLILANDPENETVLMQKAKILNSAENYEESIKTLEILLASNSANTDAMLMLDKVRLELIKNKITINYTYDYFTNASYNKDPWHMTYLQYSRKTPIGSVVGRVNWAYRFGGDAFQYEVDAYPSTGKKSYLYVNYGFSSSSIFPNHRSGLEWYRSFPLAFEGSLGGRLLYFEGSRRVIIYTGSVGKYLGNYWFSLRSYVTPGIESNSVSGSLSVRRYFADAEDYIGLRVGGGRSPDERRLLLFDNQSAELKSLSFRADYNHIFNNRWIFNTAIGFANEEYWVPWDDVIRSGNNYSIQVGFAYLF